MGICEYAWIRTTNSRLCTFKATNLIKYRDMMTASFKLMKCCDGHMIHLSQRFGIKDVESLIPEEFAVAEVLLD